MITIEETDTDQCQSEVDAHVAVLCFLEVEIPIKKSHICENEGEYVVAEENKFGDEEIKSNLVIILAHYYRPTSYL